MKRSKKKSSLHCGKSSNKFSDRNNLKPFLTSVSGILEILKYREKAGNPRPHYYNNLRRKGRENVISPLWKE
jgi:hypothetical protein